MEKKVRESKYREELEHLVFKKVRGIGLLNKCQHHTGKKVALFSKVLLDDGTRVDHLRVDEKMKGKYHGKHVRFSGTVVRYITGRGNVNIGVEKVKIDYDMLPFVFDKKYKGQS